MWCVSLFVCFTSCHYLIVFALWLVVCCSLVSYCLVDNLALIISFYCAFLSVYCYSCFCHLHVLFVEFFFCKQKPAYELRISDWSSDVCSSDLTRQAAVWARGPPRCWGGRQPAQEDVHLGGRGGVRNLGREPGILCHPPSAAAALPCDSNLGPRRAESNVDSRVGSRTGSRAGPGGMGWRQPPQAGCTQTAVSWNTAPPAGRPGSALVRRLMPRPSSKARFGQMLSTTTTSGCRPSKKAARMTSEPCRLPSRTRCPSAMPRSAAAAGWISSVGRFSRFSDPGVSVKVVLRKERAGAATRRKGRSPSAWS